MQNNKEMKDIKEGRTVWFWYGAGHLVAVTFVRWCKTKMGTGREDTDKIGIGAVVSSDYVFKRNGKGNRKQAILRPYMELYRTYKSGLSRRNEIKRPKIK